MVLGSYSSSINSDFRPYHVGDIDDGKYILSAIQTVKGSKYTGIHKVIHEIICALVDVVFK